MILINDTRAVSSRYLVQLILDLLETLCQVIGFRLKVIKILHILVVARVEELHRIHFVDLGHIIYIN